MDLKNSKVLWVFKLIPQIDPKTKLKSEYFLYSFMNIVGSYFKLIF
jgi:hypothetical protein